MDTTPGFVRQTFCAPPISRGEFLKRVGAAAVGAGFMSGGRSALARAFPPHESRVYPSMTHAQIQAAVDDGGSVVFEPGDYYQVQSPTPNVPGANLTFDIGRLGRAVDITGERGPSGERPKIHGGTPTFRCAFFPVDFALTDLEIVQPDVSGQALSYSRVGIFVVDRCGARITVDGCAISIEGDPVLQPGWNGFSMGIFMRIMGGASQMPQTGRIRISNNQVTGTRIVAGIGLGHFTPESPAYTAPRFAVENNHIAISNAMGRVTSGGVLFHGNVSGAIVRRNVVTGFGPAPGFDGAALSMLNGGSAQVIAYDVSAIGNDFSGFTSASAQVLVESRFCRCYVGADEKNGFKGNVFGAAPFGVEDQGQQNAFVKNDYRQTGIPGLRSGDRVCVWLTSSSSAATVHESGAFPAGTGDAREQVLDQGTGNRVVGHRANELARQEELRPGIGQRLADWEAARVSLREKLSAQEGTPSGPVV
jgi:hypothetical protein